MMRRSMGRRPDRSSSLLEPGLVVPARLDGQNPFRQAIASRTARRRRAGPAAAAGQALSRAGRPGVVLVRVVDGTWSPGGRAKVSRIRVPGVRRRTRLRRREHGGGISGRPATIVVGLAGPPFAAFFPKRRVRTCFGDRSCGPFEAWAEKDSRVVASVRHHDRSPMHAWGRCRRRTYAFRRMASDRLCRAQADARYVWQAFESTLQHGGDLAIEPSPSRGRSSMERSEDRAATAGREARRSVPPKEQPEAAKTVKHKASFRHYMGR